MTSHHPVEPRLDEALGAPAAPGPPAQHGRGDAADLPLRRIALYSMPSFGISVVGVVVAFYWNKFATDVLLVSPALVGLIHAVSRVWDGVTDPVVGYLSDRTQSSLGRRRPWVMAAAGPLALGLLMLWTAPVALGPRWLPVWLFAAYFIYETARTLFLIPWSALGLELTARYEERTRLFAWKHLFIMTGAIVGFGFYLWISQAEQLRAAAALFAGLGAIALPGAMLWAARGVAEPPRAGTPLRAAPWTAFADVFRNPHGRTLLILFGVENLGISATFALVPFVSEYALERPSLAAVIGLAYMLPQALLVPLCIAYAPRLEKRRLWLGSMTVSALLFALQFLYTPETPAVWIGLISSLLGAASGVGAVCSEAIQADVVDDDEARTGGRKEGSYLALWNIAGKAASGLTPLIALSSLDLVGYVPNQPQPESTRTLLLLFFSLVPAACFGAGALLLSRFRLDRAEHERIRALLGERRSGDRTS